MVAQTASHPELAQFPVLARPTPGCCTLGAAVAADGYPSTIPAPKMKAWLRFGPTLPLGAPSPPLFYFWHRGFPARGSSAQWCRWKFPAVLGALAQHSLPSPRPGEAKRGRDTHEVSFSALCLLMLFFLTGLFAFFFFFPLSFPFNSLLSLPALHFPSWHQPSFNKFSSTLSYAGPLPSVPCYFFLLHLKSWPILEAERIQAAEMCCS